MGRLALEDARGVAAGWPADAIRLDAYDAEAGQGCSMRSLGSVSVGGLCTRAIHSSTLNS